MKVHWTRKAQEDLGRIDDYFAARDPDFADRAGREAVNAARLLGEHPHMGSRRGEVRKWNVGKGPYLLVYRVAADRVEILRVRHQREDWKATDE